MADKNEVGGDENGSNKTNLLNLSALWKSIGAGVLNSKGAKKGASNSKKSSGNIKKGVEAARGSNYLTSGAKKVFNLLQHMFTQVFIF